MKIAEASARASARDVVIRSPCDSQRQRLWTAFVKYEWVVLGMCCLAYAACSEEPTSPPLEGPAQLELSRYRLGMYPGDTVHLDPLVLGGDGARFDADVMWTVSDSTVVTVDERGIVTAHAHGTSTLTATVDTLSLSVPVRVTEFTTADLGAMLCALDIAGQAWCQGDNFAGVLGESWGYSTLLPMPQQAPFDVIEVGSTHACGISQGIAYCWGDNNAGQIGSAAAPPVDVPPTPVGGDHQFVQIAVGYRHTCALDSDGIAWCWGEGGKLGTGSTESSSEPVRVAGELTWYDIAADGWRTCAIANDEDRVYCWGANSGFADWLVPHDMVWAGAGVVDVGNGRVCASVGYRVDCWVYPESVWLPRLVREVAAAADATCALTLGHVIHCWGENLFGQLGTDAVDWTAEPIQIDSPLPFDSLSGYGDGFCAVTEAGALYCWGRVAGRNDRLRRPTRIDPPLP
ncbi:MAG TPA: Ig-like domain-containing protein [Longimicrobiales bacterium]